MINRINTISLLFVLGFFGRLCHADNIEGENLNIVGPSNFYEPNYMSDSIMSGIFGQGNDVNSALSILTVGDYMQIESDRGHLAVGYGNESEVDYYGMVSGQWNDTSSTTSSITVGNFNSLESSVGSAVFGEYNSVIGSHHYVFGVGLLSGSNLAADMVVGHYNAVSTDQVFTVGNGTESNRHNAFSIKDNGDVRVHGGKLILTYATNASPVITLDPNAGQITIYGQKVLVANTSGNVGIGTSAPSERLTVIDGGDVNPYAGTFGVYAQNLTQGITIGYTGITKTGSNASGDLNINAKGAGNLILQTNATGNVGVGTNIPRGKFEIVNGSANADADPAGDLTIVGGNKSIGGTGSEAANLSIQTNDGSNINSGGSIGFGSRYNGDNLFANYAAIKGAREDSTAGNYGGYLVLGTRPNGGVTTERMRILSNGNIGIRTTTPNSDLHIVGQAKSDSNIDPTGNSNATIEGNYSGRTPGTGAALGFVVPANTDGGNRWEQGRILVTPDNANSSDASGRMYLQTRYSTPGAWNWKSNIVLASNGDVKIPKRQGDIVMGEFGNGNGD